MGNRTTLDDVKTDSELREEVKQLREDLAAIREDFRGVASEAVRTGKQSLHNASEGLKSAAHDAAEWSAHTGREAIHKAEDQVTAHPFASLAAAFAGGAILGAYLRGNRS
jgi:ElaB/YqjD/DUF883 family membrane-anchored ribosome-binding protein